MSEYGDGDVFVAAKQELTNSFYLRGTTHVDASILASLQEGQEVEFRVEPDNPHHKAKYPISEAISVWAGANQIGWVPAELCGWWAEHVMEPSGVVSHVDLNKRAVRIMFIGADEIMPRQKAMR